MEMCAELGSQLNALSEEELMTVKMFGLLPESLAAKLSVHYEEASKSVVLTPIPQSVSADNTESAKTLDTNQGNIATDPLAVQAMPTTEQSETTPMEDNMVKSEIIPGVLLENITLSVGKYWSGLMLCI